MRRDDQRDGRVDTRELLDDDRVLDVAETCAAEFFGKDRAEIPELAAVLDHFERESLSLIPLEHVRRDLALRKLAYVAAEFDLVFREAEVHDTLA